MGLAAMRFDPWWWIGLIILVLIVAWLLRGVV
jgi:hypothetical protein